MDALDLTILIPVYNEEAILEESMGGLLHGTSQRFAPGTFELMLCENGSSDHTLSIAARMCAAWPEIRLEKLPARGYGQALRHGISLARGERIAIFNADFWDLDFLDRALEELSEHDIVIGSKNVPGARDDRPYHRRMVTKGFNDLLRLLFGFHGSDTHGIKAMRSERVKPLAAQCVTDGEIFDTELILRAQMSGLSFAEIPVDVREIRPSRYSVWKRIPKTIIDLITLVRIFGLRNLGK
jgi:glycosyltransferase involved in cell wall biosynthesis